MSLMFKHDRQLNQVSDPTSETKEQCTRKGTGDTKESRIKRDSGSHGSLSLSTQHSRKYWIGPFSLTAKTVSENQTYQCFRVCLSSLPLYLTYRPLYSHFHDLLYQTIFVVSYSFQIPTFLLNHRWTFQIRLGFYSTV